MRPATFAALLSCTMTLATFAPALAQDAGATPAAAPLADIRGVDFMNFIYSSLGGTRIRVRNGRWERPAREPAFNGEFLAVVDVQYGDLTGDGRDEAVVWLEECGGGTGHFSFANVYTPTTGTPRRIGRVPAGDRADGGIGAVRVVGGRLEVERFGHDRGGAMDVAWVETETWSVRGGGLHFEANADRRAYLDLSWGTRSPRIRFLPRTRRATVVGYLAAHSEDRWAVRVRRGAVLDVDLSHLRAGGYAVVEGLRVEVRAADGTVHGAVTAGTRERVDPMGPCDCLLVVTARAAGSYRMDVGVLDGGASEAPSARP